MFEKSKVASIVAESLVDELNVGTADTIKNVIEMLDNDLTVPFIARYRKGATNGMEAELIRKIQQTYEQMKQVKVKAESVIKKLNNVISDDVIFNFRNAKSFEEIEEIYAPYKSGGKGTLAERARKIGLDELAQNVLRNSGQSFDLLLHLNNKTEGLKTTKEIVEGIQHIIADIVSKDARVKQKMKEGIGQHNMFIVSKAKAKELDTKQKFSDYYNFRSPLNRIQSHTLLAINRGESLKILQVKYEFAEQTRKWILQWISKLFLPKYAAESNQKIIENAICDSFKRLIEKSFLRKVKVSMKRNAELDALDVFHNNLKHLLLVAPVKNKSVLAIDPGFTNGCKIAVIDKNGKLLDTAVIFPFKWKLVLTAENILTSLVQKYGIEVMAIGNGTACRETEQFISSLIKKEAFKPLQVSYSIVSECGASIYSVTKEAKNEFGNLDPNLVSAVSIGRRLQDPLLELHKIEAKHIGVGMYQHDLDSNLLNGAVNGVIEECVSFVGVDINACSAQFLSRVSGISSKQAELIVSYREKNGAFVNRKELLNVKSVGEKTFKNCAGFIRILSQNNVPDTMKIPDSSRNEELCKSGKRKLAAAVSSTSSKRRKLKANQEGEMKFEPLDQTWIHPESYAIAHAFLKKIGGDASMIGSNQMKELIQKQTACNNDVEKLSEELSTNKETIEMIIQGLCQPPDYDIRQEFEKPAFRTGVTKMEQLKVDQSISGIVRNVTSFGTFVDIGVNVNGLIHKSKIPNGVTLGPGDRVDCVVQNVDISRNRIGLIYKQKVSQDLKLR